MPERFVQVRSMLLSCAVTAIACAAGWINAVARAEPASSAPAGEHTYLGVVACARCHRAPTPEDKEANTGVALTEYTTWSTQDKHKDAYEVLLKPRAQRMQQLLGYDVTKDGRCLSCHAVDCSSSKCDTSFVASRGVSCEACHGPSSDWVDPHWKPGWRGLTAAQKESRGMRDVWNPKEQAKLCCSCHVGDAAQGKFVSHKMYAAGHPPLPSIELAAFMAQMPPHWIPLEDKPQEVRATYKNRLPTAPQSKMVVLGGAVALEANLKLLVEHAKGGADPQRDWPELALYDCYACHHELQMPSWRQARGYDGPPGRPTVRQWPLTASQVAFAKLEPSGSSISAVLEPFRNTLGATPFGDRDELAKAVASAPTTQGMARIAELIDAIAAAQFDAKASRDCLLTISKLGEGNWDFDSARQLAWGFRAIYYDLHPRAENSEIDSILDQLEQQLSLGALKAGQDTSAKSLSIFDSRIGQFDPKAVQKLFSGLRKPLEAF